MGSLMQKNSSFFLNKINDDTLIYQLNNKNFKTKFAVIPLKNSNEYIVFIELSNISLYDIEKIKRNSIRYPRKLAFN